MSHLYVGGGFPRASQCITTFFSSESKGKITSSGSWTKTGPNSSLSMEGKKKEIKTRMIAIITTWVPLSFHIQLLFLLFPSLVSVTAYFLPTSITGNKRTESSQRWNYKQHNDSNNRSHDILQQTTDLLTGGDAVVIYLRLMWLFNIRKPLQPSSEPEFALLTWLDMIHTVKN